MKALGQAGTGRMQDRNHEAAVPVASPHATVPVGPRTACLEGPPQREQPCAAPAYLEENVRSRPWASVVLAFQAEHAKIHPLVVPACLQARPLSRPRGDPACLAEHLESHPSADQTAACQMVEDQTSEHRAPWQMRRAAAAMHRSAYSSGTSVALGLASVDHQAPVTLALTWVVRTLASQVSQAMASRAAAGTSVGVTRKAAALALKVPALVVGQSTQALQAQGSQKLYALGGEEQSPASQAWAAPP